ncbi:MAG: hypothetical protein D6684_12355 [Deinococcus-Thermus bacterium]|nr:MAG: hypothetical protein D6684_12355 [Deinococcota bacterium]
MQRIWVLALGLLLAACSGGTGGSGNAGNGSGSGSNNVSVRIVPQTSQALAYYRVGQGGWQAITFTGSQAGFSASGEYEVAAKCAGSLQLFKATPEQISEVTLICPSGPLSFANATLNVQPPAQIGGVNLQDGDWVVVLPGSAGSGSGPLSGGQATFSLSSLAGQQKLLITVLRVDVSGSNPSINPIGWRLVDLDLQNGQSYLIDNTGWQPFAGSSEITTTTPPSGYNGGAFVLFFKDGMKQPGTVGGFNRYGLLGATVGGKYLGFAQFSQGTNPERKLLALKETGGSNWAPSLAQPWPSGGLSVNGTSFTVSYPGALAFSLSASGLLRNAGDGTPLELRAFFFPGGPSTTYALPSLEGQLGYTVVGDPSANRTLEASALTRGSPIKGLMFAAFQGSGEPSEAMLQGIDLAWASVRVSYSSPNYTLP